MRKNMKWSLLSAIVLVVAAGTFVWWQYFRDAWQPPSVVTIESSDELFSFFPSYPMWTSDAEEGAPQALLLRDGDYIIGDNAVRYLATDGLALKLTSNDWSTSLGGKIVVVKLDKDDGLKWLSAAPDSELAELRTVACPDDVDAPMLLALQRLAAVNAQVDLEIDSGPALRQVLPLFKPRAIFLDDTEVGSLELLASQPQLETLLMEGSKPGSLEILPKLPKLRSLFLGDWDVEQAGPIPAGLDGLKSLGVFQGEIEHLDLLALSSAPASLETLVIAADGITGLSQLGRMTGLRTLILWGGDNKAPVDLSSLATLKALRWMGLPSQVGQQQFADLVNTHPRLAILELPETDTTLDLAPLRKLKDLQGLVLNGKYTNLDVVQQIKSLRYLGISKDNWDDSSAQIAAIRKALPDAVVVRTGGMCLGSGWILLLIPVLGFAWRRRSARSPFPQAA